MRTVLRLSQLSPARQALVRILQAVNFGEIRGVRVQDADPILEDDTVVVIDTKLDKAEEPRAELGLADFELRDEVCRLMARIDAIGDGVIERLEVRAGIPRRIVFKSRLTLESRRPELQGE
jgi:hypothetical protein